MQTTQDMQPKPYPSRVWSILANVCSALLLPVAAYGYLRNGRGIHLVIGVAAAANLVMALVGYVRGRRNPGM